MTKLDTKLVEHLFELGAHLGHKKSRLDPKAKKNVYSILNGTSIIDLSKTVEQLEKAKSFLAEISKEGKIILVVGTKKVADVFIKNYCTTKNISYVSTKWLPGLLTNFETIMKNVKKLKSLKSDRETGAWAEVVKHERMKMSKEITKLERLYGGIENLEKKPDVIVIVDAKKEKNALKEAQSYNLPVVAMIDTNSNPDKIAYPIVANDDSSGVIDFVMTELLNSYEFKPQVKEEKAVELPVAA